MRAVTHGDAVAAASLIFRVSPESWETTLQTIFDRAHAADLYRKRLARVHPQWGNGSLMGAVVSETTVWPEPRLADPDYAEAMIAVLFAVMRWRQRS